MPRNYTRRTRGGKRRKRGGRRRSMRGGNVYRSVDAVVRRRPDDQHGVEVKCLVPHALADKDFDDALRTAIEKLKIAEKKIAASGEPSPNPIAATGVPGVPAVTKPVVLEAASAAPMTATNEDSGIGKAAGEVLDAAAKTAGEAGKLATAAGQHATDKVTTIAKNTTDGAKNTAKGVFQKMADYFKTTRASLNAPTATNLPVTASAAGGGRRRRKRFRRGAKSETHSGKDFETRKKSKRYRRKSFKRRFGRVTARAPLFPFVGGRRTRRRRGGRGKRRRR